MQSNLCRPHHRVFRVATAALTLPLVSCFDAPVEEDASFRGAEGTSTGVEPSETSDTRPYVHALSNLPRVNGKLPLFDIKDDPTGRRYAVEVSASQESEFDPVVKSSGLVTLDRRPLSKAKPGTRAPGSGLDAIGPTLVERIDEKFATGRERLDDIPVSVRVAAPKHRGLLHRLERLVAGGEITTYEEYEARRADLVRERQQDVARVLAPVVTDFKAMGVAVRPAKNSYNLEILATAGQLTDLVDHPAITRLDYAGGGTDAAMSGYEVVTGSQIDQFLDHANKYDGNGPSGSNHSDDITFAVIERYGGGGYDEGHLGYRECEGCSFRTLDLIECDSSGCDDTISGWNPTGDHATAVAGIIFGDLYDDQDPDISDFDDQRERSGKAPEAKGYLYRGGTCAGTRSARDHVMGLSTIPLVTNLSFVCNDNNCAGTGNDADLADAQFEDGGLSIYAAGNNGTSGNNCMVRDGNDALSAFAVAGHEDPGLTGIADVRYGNMLASGSIVSSMGGTSTEGRGRSVIDISAPGMRTKHFTINDGYRESGHSAGTSYAAPTVTGAAIDFIDWWRKELGAINNPGTVYANLLLMGDRYYGSQNNNDVDCCRTAEFNGRMGAGHLKMRMFNAAGGDSPWGWASGNTCIDEDEEYPRPINGGYDLSGDVDDFKAVIFWYEDRFNEGEDIADIDLVLRDIDTEEILNQSVDFDDNKEMVYSDDVGDRSVEILIQGVSGFDGADDPVCGTDSVRVFYVIYYEDGDRDDWISGPDWDGTTLVGVEPGL